MSKIFNCLNLIYKLTNLNQSALSRFNDFTVETFIFLIALELTAFSALTANDTAQEEQEAYRGRHKHVHEIQRKETE